MAFTETLKERQAISWVTTATINAGATATTYTPGVNMGVIRRVRGFFMLGTLTGGASVNIYLQSSATENGTYTAITNNDTNPTVTAITTDDSLNALEIRADQLPTGHAWVRAYASETASANAVVTILLVGDECSYKPGNQFNEVTLTNDVVTFTNQ